MWHGQRPRRQGILLIHLGSMIWSVGFIQNSFIVVISNHALEVCLKDSNKNFRRVQPQAANMISVAREMHALDLLTYYHGSNIACVNTSQSLHCMPMVTSYNDPLPCLTFGAKYFKIMFNSVALCGTFNPSQFFSSHVVLFRGPTESSWSCLTRRRNPDILLGERCYFSWAFLSTEWLAWKMQVRMFFGSKLTKQVEKKMNKSTRVSQWWVNLFMWPGTSFKLRSCIQSAETLWVCALRWLPFVWPWAASTHKNLWWISEPAVIWNLKNYGNCDQWIGGYWLSFHSRLSHSWNLYVFSLRAPAKQVIWTIIYEPIET